MLGPDCSPETAECRIISHSTTKRAEKISRSALRAGEASAPALELPLLPPPVAAATQALATPDRFGWVPPPPPPPPPPPRRLLAAAGAVLRVPRLRNALRRGYEPACDAGLAWRHAPANERALKIRPSVRSIIGHCAVTCGVRAGGDQTRGISSSITAASAAT